MAVKKMRERVHNGGNTGTEADWDTIHYETSEDMIVGQKQLLEAQGYKVHPGGLIEQWGTVDVYFTSQGNKAVDVVFPLQFKTSVFTVVASEQDNSMTTFGSYNVSCNSTTLNKVTLSIRNIFDSQLTGRVRVNWVAKGK